MKYVITFHSGDLHSPFCIHMLSDLLFSLSYVCSYTLSLVTFKTIYIGRYSRYCFKLMHKYVQGSYTLINSKLKLFIIQLSCNRQCTLFPNYLRTQKEQFNET
jgi:hypothetical protein